MSRNLKKKYKFVLSENSEDIISEFKTMCNEISNISGTKIDAEYYIKRYFEYTSNESIKEFQNIQERMYTYLKSMYPNIDFGIRGRAKSKFSYFQKILNKLEDFPDKSAYVNDEFANKIFIKSRDCRIDKISIGEEGPYITCGKEDIYIKPGDVLCVNLNNRYYNINITSIARNLTLKNNHIYVKTPEGLIIPVENGILKKCNNSELIPFCYKFRDEIDEFYQNTNFELVKQADYIASPKECGYSSLQDSYVLRTENFTMSTETQIKTYTMEHDSKTQPDQKRSSYKPESKVLSPSSVFKVPIYILTTAFSVKGFTLEKFECDSIIASPEQCWDYTFKEVKQENPELYLELKEKYLALREEEGYKSTQKWLDKLNISTPITKIEPPTKQNNEKYKIVVDDELEL